MGLSLSSAALCIVKYAYRFKFYKRRGYVFEQESFFSHSIFYHFLAEFLTLMIHPSPFLLNITYTQYNYESRMDVVYYVNDILVIFVMVRLLYHMFEIFQTSKYNSTRIQRINLLFNNEALSIFLPIKNYIANHPIRFMLSSFAFSIFFFSALIIMLERPLSSMTNQKLDEWTEVIWYVVVTMTTIGYGDRVAQTLVARLIIMMLVIWGNFWSSIFLSSIFPYIQQSLKEEKAFNHYNRLKLRKSLNEKSAELVSLIIQMNYLLKKENVKSKRVKKINHKAANILREIRKIKKDINNVFQDTNFFVDDIITRIGIIADVSEDQLVKGEKIYQNINQTLMLFSKKAKKTMHNIKKPLQNMVQLEGDTTKSRISALGQLKKIKTIESKDIDSKDLSNKTGLIGDIDEEDMREHKRIHKEMTKLGKNNNQALNFAGDLHEYMIHYLNKEKKKTEEEGKESN